MVGMVEQQPFKHVAVHHIDGDPRNNDRANLRLIDTRTGEPLTGEQTWNAYIRWRLEQI